MSWFSSKIANGVNPKAISVDMLGNFNVHCDDKLNRQILGLVSSGLDKAESQVKLMKQGKALACWS